jgi:hypothetical protein
MKPIFLSLLACLLSCSEQKLTAHNAEPSAFITSHTSGTIVTEAGVALEGSVSDPDGRTEDLKTTWLVNGEDACDGETPDEDGLSRCAVVLRDGANDVQLQVRDPSNAVGRDTIIIEVRVVDTEPPTARVDSPVDGDVFYTDRKVTLIGMVDDAEDEADALTVVWSSDIDGPLEEDLTVDSDGAVSGHVYLTEGEHALTLQVTDTDGKTGSDSVVVDVGPPNLPPECSITSPETDALVDPDGETTLVGMAADANQASNTLDVTWSSDRDGVLGTTAPSTGGAVTTVVSGLHAGIHTITLEVTDELGETCTSSVVVAVGTPPEITINAPVGGSILMAVDEAHLAATALDADDAETLLYVGWFSSMDGDLGGSSADELGDVAVGVTLSLGEHTLTATVTDSHGQTATDMVTFTVDDVPVVSGVEISPDPALATNVLTCTWTFFDETGGDASLATWAINGTDVATGPTLASGHAHGDLVTCTVVPSDGVLTGEGLSDELVVSNSTPSIDGVAISPSAPTASSPLECTYSGFFDADGESDVSEMVWTLGGAEVGTGPVLASGYDRGDEVTCTVTPTDGTDDGPPLSASVVIENTPPEVVSAFLSPSEAFTNSTLSLTVTTTDFDGDSVSLNHAWTVDGTTAAETGGTLDGATYFDKHQVVQVTATPSDGFTSGSPSTPLSITISNSPPSPPSLVFIPEAPVEGEDDVWCAVDGPATDPDGDGVSLGFTWELDGSPWAGPTLSTVETGDTIALSETEDGQVWRCTVTPDDGEDLGPAVSAEVTIDNAQTRVFVTSEATSSDMGGPSGADAHCQAVADTAELGGSWVAYVSGGGASAITRISDGPYYRLDGVLIAMDKADLTDGSIAAPISINENLSFTSTSVCTGSSAAGYATGGSTASGGNCVGWTRGCGVCDGNHWYVEVGDSNRTSDDWSTKGWNFCGSCHLYCFEQ